MRWFQCGIVVIAAGLAGQGAFAQSETADGAAALPEMPSSCALKGESDDIRLVLCDPGLDQATLVEAGKAACGTHLPCGTWIWTDAANVPDVAPEAHDGLTPQQVTSAQGVWVAEMESLITIDALKQ